MLPWPLAEASRSTFPGRFVHDHRRAGHPPPLDPQDPGPSVPVRPGAGHRPRRRSVDLDRAGQEAARRLRGPRGGQRGPRPARDRGGHRGADGATRLLPDHAAVLQPAGRGPGREARGPGPGRSALHHVRGERVGGQRALDADRAAVLAGLREAGQAQGHFTAGWLSRRHDGHVRGLRAAPPGPALSAARGAGFREGGATPSVPGSGDRYRGRADRVAPASCARPSCAKARTRSPR